MGCLAAYLTHSPRGFAWRGRVLGQAWSVPLMVVLLAVRHVARGARCGSSSLVMTLVVVATCIRAHQPLAPLLGHAWVRYVGTVSYGIYLMHMLSLNVVRRACRGRACRLLRADAGAEHRLSATLSYRYFESQFLKLKGRFDWRGTKPAAAAQPAVSTPANPG